MPYDSRTVEPSQDQALQKWNFALAHIDENIPHSLHVMFVPFKTNIHHKKSYFDYAGNFVSDRCHCTNINWKTNKHKQTNRT